MLDQLIAAILAFWSAANPAYLKAPRAHEIADVIAKELEPEALGKVAPVYADANEDMGAAAFFAVRESSLDPSLPGDCTDRARPETCAAHGAWQLHGPCGERNLQAQVHCWMTMLRQSPCGDHPIATFWGKCSGRVPFGTADGLAAKREARIAELLGKVDLPVVSETRTSVRLVRKMSVGHELTLDARAFLADAVDLPMGSQRLVSVDGKSFALVLEAHYHPEGFVGGPTGWHKGVTVFDVVDAGVRKHLVAE